MINKDFKRDWKHYNGEINVIHCRHFSLGVDKDGIGFSFIIEPLYKIVYIQILCLIIRFH